MKRLCRLLTLCGCVIPAAAFAQNLQTTFGNNGLQTVAYGSATLEDTSLYPADSFHIWHMRATDLAGNVLSSGQYGWGENNNGRIWNASTHTWTYQFSWGSIATQLVQTGDMLNMIVTETNDAGSGIVFDGAEIYPFALHFPSDPAGFSGYTQYTITTTEPGVSIADFGSGVVTSVIPNEAQALYGGWKNVGPSAYTPIMTGTAPDGLAAFLPHNDLPVQPGTSVSYTVSLRFTPEGTAASAQDAYASFAAKYPSQMTWTDKRILGTAYLASSPAGNGDITQPGGFRTNPRRYFNDPTIDITTAAGMQSFQDRILAQAASNVANTRNLSGQGVITWDLEGEQFPQDTSYVCSPDQVATVAPEMESTITDRSSAYFGQRLDDAYFKTMTSAGLKVGVCLRPQIFTLSTNGTASQQFLSTSAAIVANLESKARFANARWGVTIFYVDSTVDTKGGTLDPVIFQQLITDYPGFLFIPEESTPRYYAYSAPFYSFIFHTVTGTPAATYDYYPKAFGVNLVNDVAAATLAEHQPQLTSSVRLGDILMGHADYWQANDPTLVSIYEAAGIKPIAPAQVTPAIRWATPATIPYGTRLTSKQLDASVSTTGTFVYSPAAGSVLAAGTHTLLTTFTPSDPTDYTTATATVQVTVSKAVPAVTWAAPAALVSGTALGGSQLNARANVPGTFSYSPAMGTVLPVGTTSVTATFLPTDTADYASTTTSVSITVNADSKLSILTPGANATVAGTIEVLGHCSLALDAAGTYLMVDGVEIGSARVTGAPFAYPLDTMNLTNGSHVLQLWGHDIGNNTSLSVAVTITVKN